MTLDQSIIQFTNTASGIENLQILSQSFPTEELPEGKILISNETDWPADVAAAVAVIKLYSESLINE